MKIKILEIYGNIVKFESEYGIAEGIWCSTTLPEKKSYIVEFSSDSIIYKEQVLKINNNQFNLSSHENITLLTGIVDELIEDMVSIKIGDSYIDTDIDLSSELNIGDYVQLRISNLKVFDENVL